MLRFLRFRLAFPAPRPAVIWSILLAWGLALLFVDVSPTLSARASIPLVRDPGQCELAQEPQREDVVAFVGLNQELIVRRPVNRGGYTCFEVELESGQKGFVPWHPAYLRGAGIRVAWRGF